MLVNSFSKKKKSLLFVLVPFANFHGVNIPTVVYSSCQQFNSQFSKFLKMYQLLLVKLAKAGCSTSWDGVIAQAAVVASRRVGRIDYSYEGSCSEGRRAVLISVYLKSDGKSSCYLGREAGASSSRSSFGGDS